MKILSNFLSLAGAEILGKILTFAAFASLARTVGAANFGYVEWAGAILLCANLIVEQGFSLYGAREIAKTPARAADLIAHIVGARFVLAFVAFGIIIALAFGLPHTQNLRSLLLIYGASLFAAPLLMAWVFQGFDRMRTAAIIGLVRQTIFALVVLVFVRNGEQLWLVAVAEIAAVGGAAIYSVWSVKSKLHLPLQINFKVSKNLFREGVPFGLSQMFWTIKMFGATLIVGFIATAEDTGYFSAAMRIFVALHTFVWLYFFKANVLFVVLGGGLCGLLKYLLF